MGCTLSNDIVLTEPEQLESYLTLEEIRMVKESWSIVSEDYTALGLLIFKKFFEMQKGIVVLFGKLMQTKADGTVGFHPDRLQNHATIVMEGLGAAVECLEDSIHLSKILVAMGEKHAAYNVHPDMVPFLWPAICSALKELLQEKFTHEVQESWLHVFQYITCKFRQGITQGQQCMH